ncbi:MAG: Crp/Fnr family transcriptional regulator [Bryobacteraceae bacterium]
MTRKGASVFDANSFLATVGAGRTIAKFRKSKIVFSQGDPANAVFYIQKGKIKLSVLSKNGKEAVVGILGAGDFFGEGCLTSQLVRMATATALTDCLIARLEKAAIVNVLRDEAEFSSLFISHLLARNVRIEEDLVDQLFNSSEKRLARVLLLLANFGKEGVPQEVIPNISQATLAEMVGTTRSRVSSFMNKFRRLGFIKYNDRLEVHSSLLNVILRD